LICKEYKEFNIRESTGTFIDISELELKIKILKVVYFMTLKS